MMAAATGNGMGAFVQKDGSVLIGRGCPGEIISHVTGIDIRLRVGELVSAEITVAVTPETIEAHPMLSRTSLEEAAKLRGLDLAPIGFASHEDLASGAVVYHRKT